MTDPASTPPPAETALPEVRFLRGLADLIEQNVSAEVGYAEPGRLLTRLDGCLNDDRDQTVHTLLALGFVSGNAEEACWALGLLDGH